MPEVNLGNQRLSVSMALGNEFALEIEKNSTDLPLAIKVRSRFFQNPNTHVIGSKVEKDTTLQDIIEKLNSQISLPEGSDLGAIGDRLVGEKKDFVIVLNGFVNLPANQQKEISSKLGKLKVEILTDST